MASKNNKPLPPSKPSLMKKIDHPLSKYNSSGQLFCVLCNVQVKSEMWWTGHINGKQHREALTQLKKAKNEPSTPTKSEKAATKRPIQIKEGQTPPPSPVGSMGPPASPSPSSVPKRLRLSSPLELSPMPPPPSILKRPGGGHREEGEGDQGQVSNQKNISLTSDDEHSLMDVDSSYEVDKNQPPSPQDDLNQTTPLPTGFFDDPSLDAKARGVKIEKKKEDLEWEEFVKVIAKEEVKSGVLLEEDEEENRRERELGEIEEQMGRWGRVLELEKLAEDRRRRSKKESEDDKAMNLQEDEDNEEDYEEELDWRTKKK